MIGDGWLGEGKGETWHGMARMELGGFWMGGSDAILVMPASEEARRLG